MLVTVIVHTPLAYTPRTELGPAMVNRRSGRLGALTAVVWLPVLLPSLRSAMVLPGSAVAVTVTPAAADGSWTVTGMLALPPMATLPPEQVATPPLAPQLHPLSAAPVTAAPPLVATRTVTFRAMAALVADGLATRMT